MSWLIIALCVVGHFFFSTAETALSCCNRFKMQVEADDGRRSAKLIVKVCEKFDRALTTILVGNNIVAVAISTVSTMLFYRYLSNTGLSEYASLISSIIMTLIVYILGDTLPKTIARAIPDTMSKIVIFPIYGLMIIFTPITIIFEGMVKLFEIIFKNKGEEDFTSEDLEKVLEHGEEEGILEEEQVDIIQSALEFADTKAKDVLTRRNKIFALDINGLTNEKLNEIINHTNYSRIPLYDQDLDHYIGVIHVKTYIKEYLTNPSINIKDIVQEPYIVPNKIMLVDLLEGFKKHHTHLAMVENNDHHIIGMVTMEDVLEELVENISEPNVTKGEVA
ncbi:MAG: CNNM domain-containing protein [Bacilli bacterium]|nr:CNNM domain-containing protein [Bacilli bacterium]